MNRQGKALATLVLGTVLAAGLAIGLSPDKATAVDGADQYSMLPQGLSLSGVVRDFRERGTTGGHSDFELNPSGGFGHYVNMVQDTLGSSGKPVYRSSGNKVNTEFRDSAGRNIMGPRSYISAREGDVAGSVS